MTTPTTIQIDNVEYVRKDSVKEQDVNTEGLKYVIVRSRDQGVMSGYLVGYEGRSVTLLKARQVWRYDSKFVLTDFAELGPRDASACKLSCEVSGETIMLEACAIIPCTKEGGEAIRSIKAQSK